MGHLLEVAAVPRQGRRSSTTSGTALTMPMQRDAMRAGRRPDLNTEDPKVVAKAGKRPRPADRHLQHQGRDHRLPDAARRRRRGCTSRGRATCSAAAFYYMPKGVPAERPLLLGAGEANGVVQNDFFCIGRGGEESRARPPVHRLLPRREDRVREHGQLRRLHPAAERRSTPTR